MLPCVCAFKLMRAFVCVCVCVCIQISDLETFECDIAYFSACVAYILEDGDKLSKAVLPDEAFLGKFQGPPDSEGWKIGNDLAPFAYDTFLLLSAFFYDPATHSHSDIGRTTYLWCLRANIRNGGKEENEKKNGADFLCLTIFINKK